MGKRDYKNSRRSIEVTPEDILIADLSKGVKLRLPSAVHRYLAMKTDFDIRGWECSPARFEDKWRLAMMIMEDRAQDNYVNYVFAGGTLYPIGGRDPVFCSKCLNEMSQNTDDTFLCRHCDTSDDANRIHFKHLVDVVFL